MVEPVQRLFGFLADMPDLTLITFITLKTLEYGLFTRVREGKNGVNYESRVQETGRKLSG
jgi:hypothetical protein